MKNRTTIGSSNPTSGSISDGIKSGSIRDIYTPMFTAVFFTIIEVWTHPKCPSMDEWIMKI